MCSNISNKLNIYTKIAQNKRVKILRWFARQDEEVILLAFERQKTHLFKLSQIKEENRSIIYLSAMYLAIDTLYQAGKLPLSKNKGSSLEEIQNITDLQIRQFKKNIEAPKIERLLNLKGKMITLRNDQNMSYRDISKFLKKYHRLDVSHTTIHAFFKHIMEQKE